MSRWTSQREACDQGASAVEYGLIVFAVAAVAALVIFSLGLVNQASFKSSCDQIKSKIEASDCP